jgi:peptide/nickel transport system substrate-binding protein
MAARSRYLLAGASLMVLLAAACGSQSSNTTTKGPLIVEKIFDSDTLDPARGVAQLATVVDSNVYDKLLVVNPNDLSKPYPDLATSYTSSADGSSYTFTLRQGIKFASGDPLTSADVVFSLNRVLGLNLAPAGTIGGLTFTAAGPYTVVVGTNPHMSNPAIPVEMTQFNAVILDSKLVEAHGGTTTKQDQAESFLNGPSKAGTGPYYIQSADLTSQVVLKANPNYWGPKPSFETIILRNAPAATQSLDIQDGQADLALDIGPLQATSLDSSKVTVLHGAALDSDLIFMNASTPLTSNQNFRDAVKDALNYQGLLGLAGPGAIRATGFVPVGVLGSLPSSAEPTQDLAAARAALAQVGVANPTVTLTYASDQIVDGIRQSVIATEIQSDLGAIGITVNFHAIPIVQVIAADQAGKVQMLLSSNVADYPDPSDYVLWAPGGFLGGWFHQTPIGSLYTNATSAVQPADREAAYQALGTAMNSQNYAIFLFQPARVLVEARSVHATIDVFTYVDLRTVT